MAVETDVAKPKDTPDAAPSWRQPDTAQPVLPGAQGHHSLLTAFPPGLLRAGPSTQPATDLLGRMPSPGARQQLILHVQQARGNRYAQRVISNHQRCTQCADDETAPSHIARTPEPAAPTQPAPAEEEPELDLPTGFGWVEDAWESLKGQATGALFGLEETANSGAGGLQATFDAISSQVSDLWEGVQSAAEILIQAAQDRGVGLLSGILGHIGAIGSALIDLDAGRLRAAWSALTGVAGQALSIVKTAAGGIAAQLQAKWSQVQSLADSLIGGLAATAADLLGSLSGTADSALSTIGGLWESLTGSVRPVLEQVPGWSTIETIWSGLWKGLQATASRVVGGAESLWQGIQSRVDSVWHGVEAGWSGLQRQIGDQAAGLVRDFETIGGALRVSAIDKIVDTIGSLSGFFAAARDAVQNPQAVVDPIAKEITARLANLPEQSRAEAQTRVQEAAGGGGDQSATAGPGGPAGAASPAPTPAPAIARIMRQPAASAPRSRLGVGQILSGVGSALSGVLDQMTAKLAQVWANLTDEVVKMLVEAVWPPAIWRGLLGDLSGMAQQIGTLVSRFDGFRIDSIAHFAEDVQRFGSSLTDIPIILWRTANAMVGRLGGFITVWLMALGAVAGGVGGGFAGAVLGLLGGGVTAGGTTPAGGIGGAISGAGVGLAAAGAVGVGLAASFVLAELAAIGKAVVDLLIVAQTPEEQNDDVGTIANSGIAVAVMAVLAGMSWVGVQLAKRIWTLVKAIPGGSKAKPQPDGAAPSETQPNQQRPIEERPPTADGPHVTSEHTTRDGAKIKQLDDGTSLICRVCELIPRPTPQELALIDHYTEQLANLQAAKAANDADGIRAANLNLDEIEKIAMNAHRKGGPYQFLVEHIDALAQERARFNQNDPVLGMGVRSTCSAARYGSFRDRPFAEIEQMIGRVPDAVEQPIPDLALNKMPSRAIRVTWKEPDGSLVHVDVPGSGNDSPFEHNRISHVARVSPDNFHLSDNGISVPTASTPAHTVIQFDARLRAVITGK